MCRKSDSGQAIIHLAMYFISCLMAFVINKQVVTSLPLQAVGHSDPLFGTSTWEMLPSLGQCLCPASTIFSAIISVQRPAANKGPGSGLWDQLMEMFHDRVAPNPTVHRAPPRPDPWCWAGDALIHTLLPACSHHHGNSSDIKLRYPSD